MSSFSQPEESGNNKRSLLLIGGCLTIVLCFACLSVVGLAAGMIVWQEYGESFAFAEQTPVVVTNDQENGRIEPTPTTELLPTASPTASDTAVANNPPLSETETSTPTEGAPQLGNIPHLNVPPEIEQQEVPDRGLQDLENLFITKYPTYDVYEASVRLDGFQGERTVIGTPYQIGDTRQFRNDGADIEATLVAVTEHTYFWVEDGLNLDNTAVTAAANRFETEYYDELTALFGNVWDPGVDNDPRFSVLHVSSGDGTELGYFLSSDEYPKTLFSESNEQEMIYLNMDSLNVGDDLYDATLIHEVQHLIQWHMDPSESAWLNEGLSQLAEIYLGFTDTADTADYLEQPTTRLDTWSYHEDEIYAHYGGAYLFSVYLWEQLGTTAVRELALHPANGLASVRQILQGYAPEMTLEEFAANWAVANYLDSDRTGSSDTRFSYENLELNSPAWQHTMVPGAELDVIENLDQFGVNYIDLTDLRGPVTITFAGDTTSRLVDADLREENDFWFAPPVNGMNAMLTAVFDLTAVDQADLSYAIWYDLEDDYDFAYVSISTDGGVSWQKLPPEQPARDDDFAYNGRSTSKPDSLNGWLKETISLDSFVGQNIHLRFDVLTDSAITGRGLALDDIVIQSSNAQSSFENEIVGWQAEGFVHTGWLLPQQWAVRLITKDAVTAEPIVTPLTLNDQNQGQWQYDFGKDGGVLVIMPQTPFVKDQASYWLNVQEE